MSACRVMAKLQKPSGRKGWFQSFILAQREEKALRLYNALATKTDDADCINLFKMLAQEEAKHKQTFETLYDDHMAQLGD